jgi:hypothetical protein
MAKRTSANIQGILFLVGILGLVADLTKASEHQQACPKCLGRDYLKIALDVAHLWEMS